MTAAAQNSRVSKFYDGILAEPIAYKPPTRPLRLEDGPPPGWPAKAVEIWPLAVARVQQKYLEDEVARRVDSCKRFVALCNHFNVDVGRQGWDRDLWARLAQRHEPELWSDGRVSALFEKYSVDPCRPDADRDMAIAIALKHVPGMRYAVQEPIECRLSFVDVMSLLAAYGAITEHLRANEKRVSDRQVALVLRDPRRLRSILPETSLAEIIVRLVGASGNKRRTVAGSLSNKTLRDYFRQLRRAPIDYFSGRATGFQRLIIEQVVPFVRQPNHNGAEAPGQI